MKRICSNVVPIGSLYIGIDPGSTGALCAFIPGIEPKVQFIDFVSNMEFKDLALKIDVLLAAIGAEYVWGCLEQVQATPIMGKKSLFTFGKNIQIWYDVLNYLGIPYIEVRPQAWMNDFILLGEKREGVKINALLWERVKELCPVDTSIFFTSRGKYRDGRGAAFLLAYYLKERLRYDYQGDFK